jgi:hypothetical protein
MEMETKGRGGPKYFDQIWIDMASHVLSIVIGFLPGGHIDYDTASCVIEERLNRIEFEYVTPSGRCAVDCILRDLDAGTPERRFGVNGFIVDWKGYADDDGIYRALLEHDGEEARCNDFLHIFIEEFVKAVRGEGGRVIVPGEEGLLNLEYQVELLRLAERA